MENIYNEPAISALQDKISRWMMVLQQDPVWREFNRQKMAYTLTFDDLTEENGIHEFEFEPEKKKEHELLTSYIELIACYNTIAECEYYFRRFPFRGLPVRHADYLTRNCEVFFNKIYEFKARMKNLGAAYKALSPKKYMDTGRLIKGYDKQLSYELKERNLLNHHTRFSDVMLTKLGIMNLLKEDKLDLPFLDRSDVEYRRLCKIWIKRIRNRSKIVRAYLVAIAGFLSENCVFLTDLTVLPNSNPPKLI